MDSRDGSVGPVAVGLASNRTHSGWRVRPETRRRHLGRSQHSCLRHDQRCGSRSLGGRSNRGNRRRSRHPRGVLDELPVAAQPVPEDAPRRLALLRAGTNLKLPDCCVLLAAEQTDAAVATFDRRLADAATERGLVARDQ
jgi:hypothetical protein